MSKILGLDLGTNSIGWAIRETESLRENQIIDYGVIVFEKGVGDGKSGEFSLAAERRKNRGKRRLYNAKRYRKWELLKVLIDNNMCPLKAEELKLWSIGKWQSGKNIGRKYPLTPDFIRWLAMDFEKIGKIYEEGEKLKPEFANPYLLRCYLLENKRDNNQKTNYQIGRALYHLAQRRGFKTSRKSGKSGYAQNEEIEKIKKENPSIQLAEYVKDKFLSHQKRFRSSGVIQRKYYEEEFIAICKNQGLDDKLINILFNAVYFVRPLRSQKGLVGKCTLEKGKPRIPLCHPSFEEFRALSFINNIQWRETNSNNTFETIPIVIKKAILEQVFFKKKKDGIIDDRNYFKFEEIVKHFSENHKFEFNYAKYNQKKIQEEGKYELTANPTVSACPVIAGLMNVFEKEWKNKFINENERYGINWDGLTLKYHVQYGTRKAKWRKGKRIFESKEIGAAKVLNYEEIWHLLFDFIHIKDKPDELKIFCKEVLEWNEEKTNRFTEVRIQQGYGSLSKNAICKIMPYLQDGNIYSEAVSFANLTKIFGKENFLTNKEIIKNAISETIKRIDNEKEKLTIVNGLIQKYFGELQTNKAKGLDEKIKILAKTEVERKLIGYFGENSWNKKSEKEKKEYYCFVHEKYLIFLDGKQKPEEKASFRQGKNPDIDFYLLPRLDEAIKETLKTKFHATEAGLKYLYHPSDIDIYPKSTKTKQIVNKETGEIKIVPQLGDPLPPSKGWKNPMAMRTMYELRKLVNYLLEVEKVDKETKVVIEMARELNDANKRKAIEYWQNDRKKENEEYATAILEMFNLTSPSDEDYNRFRAAVEQNVENERYPEIQKKYNEFIDTFLVKKIKNKDEEIIESNIAETESITYDYLMYLILTREGFTRLLMDQPLGAGRILNAAKDFKNKRNAIKDMITRYRLWKQQSFQCLYTGHHIPFTKLFSHDYQIEHTIPRSISFDSELKNLTVCDASYNNEVKTNLFPTECPNYNKSTVCKTVKGDVLCTPIKERVDRMIKPKVDELRKRIDNLKTASRKIQDWEKDKKNANIRLRHYLQFELEYWEKKYLTFTVERKDWKDKWKNSQLVDTQIITKFARAYMKSLFHHVDVQKGSTVNEFKKIYGIKGEEQKDRSRHSHHAIDASVLTLIPGSARREEILKQYYEASEEKKNFHTKPYPEFDITHISTIDENILINHISRNKALVKTRKKVRKRGKVQLTKKGREMIMQGDSIRGQLHKETFFGAIKVPERNEQGYAIRDNEKFKVKEDELWIVVKEDIKQLKNTDFENKGFIVDELLRLHINKQLINKVPLSEVKDFKDKPIRHIRCRVKSGGGGYLKKAFEIKLHSHPPNQDHKKYKLAQNSPEGNYLYLIYKNKDEGSSKMVAKIISLFDLKGLGFSKIKEIWNDSAFNQIENGIPLQYILRVGQKVIFYSAGKEELKELTIQELQKRLFIVYKFNEMGTPYIYLQNNIEARPEAELGILEKKKDGYLEFDKTSYQYRLKLKVNKLNCIFEGTDFLIKPDGEIEWNF